MCWRLTTAGLGKLRVHPAAGNGFGLTDGARIGAVSDAIGLFLDVVRNRFALDAVEVV